MNLFDNLQRKYLGPADYAEPRFSFLNRSARPAVRKIRELLEYWFEQFPDSGKRDLLSRFRSDDDRHHLGAFFELYCHALLTRQGYTAELHPDGIQEGLSHPDFLVKKAGKPLFYLESTVLAESDEEKAGQARLDQVYDALKRLDSPDFFIGIEIEQSPKHPPSAARLRSFLARNLQELDPDDLTQIMAAGGLEALPRWIYVDNDWKIELFPIPKPKDVRGRADIRPVGLRSYGYKGIDCHGPLLKTFTSKASRYGVLDSPYVIAVNVIHTFIDEIDVDSALFGRPQYQFLLQNGRYVGGRWKRALDGFWIGPSGPRNQRVSGIMTVLSLVPWAIASATPVLWHNPWANKPLDTELWYGDQKIVNLETGSMESRVGRHARDTLGLEADWPDGNTVAR